MPSGANPLAAALVAVAGAAALTACTADYGPEPPDPQLSVTGATTSAAPPALADIRAENRSRYVATRFPQHPVVLGDETGAASAELFFPASDTAVVAGTGNAAQLRAASIAVFAHAPLLTYTPDTHSAVVEEIGRLGANRILTVGEVDLAETVGDVTVTRDPGTMAGLGDLTAHQFIEVVVQEPGQMVQAVANLDGSTPIVLTAAWEPAVQRPVPDLPAFPVGSRRDAQQGPLVVATPLSPVAAVANARSFGAEVRVVPEPDPRRSRRGLAAMAGMADQPLVALGEQFGSGAALARAIEEAESRASATRGPAAD